MKLRLVSDGTFEGTYIEDEHHGRLEDVVFISYSVVPGKPSELILRIEGVPSNIAINGCEMQITTDHIIQYRNEKRIP